MADVLDLLWRQKGIFYNLYVRSFKDTNNNGVGDLQGVIEKLDYLRELGVDVIWLSGMLDSPWLEFGFDVRDYTAIYPALGNLEVFDELLRQAHQRGMQIIIDFILSLTTLPASTPGSSNHARAAITRSAAGINGLTLARMGRRPITG